MGAVPRLGSDQGRDHLLAYYGTLGVIAAIIVLGAGDPSVAFVCLVTAVALVLPPGLWLRRRQERATTLRRLEQQNTLYNTDPDEYMRRLQNGEL